MVQLLRWGAMAFGFLMIGLTTSCQLLADIHTYEADPVIKGCKLPNADVLGPNEGKVRLAHLYPSKDTIDICIRPANATSYGRPVFRNSGQDKNNICGAGLAYQQVTYPFKVQAGNLDVKIIAAGKTCTADALAEAKNVAVTTEFGVTLAYMGSAATGATLVAMTELQKSATMNRRTRMVNAVAGTSLNWGFADTSTLPAAYNSTTKFFTKAIEFGHTANHDVQANNAFEVDDNGYVGFGSTGFNIVAALENSSKAVLIDPQSGPGLYTLYAIGEPRKPGVKPAFPLRGLSCKDELKDSRQEQLTACTPTELEFISVDVYNAGLYGAFAAVEAKRADPVLQAIAKRGVEERSDIMCVSEISRHDGLPLPNTPGPETDQTQWTQERLMRLAKVPGGYQYFVQGKTDLTTPPTDPTAQDGTTPPVPTEPPCNPSLEMPPSTTIDGAYNCLASMCGSTGGFDGVTQGGTACYSQKCTVPLAGWWLGSLAQKTCINCVIANGLSYMSWEQNRQACTTDVHQNLAFNGTPTSMILSKFKVLESDQFVLPTTIFRRVALYAKLEYDPETQLDFYCIHAPPLLGTNLPYTGYYSNGASRESGAAWAEEQTWAIKKIIDWINKKSEGRYAIVAGDFSSSATSKDANGEVLLTSAGVPLIADVNPDTVLALRSNFLEAVPSTPDYRPVCTRCPAEDKGTRTNPYNKGVQDAQLNVRVFIKDPWEENPTISDSLFFDDLEAINFGAVIPDFGIAKGPLSDTFGHNVRMTNPPSTSGQ